MEKYMPLSALVAELNKRLQERKSIKPSEEDDFGKGYLWGRDTEDKAILYFINTLEVKEVDLEEEIGIFFGDDDWKASALEEEQRDMIKFARHFFELGLKARQ